MSTVKEQVLAMTDVELRESLQQHGNLSAPVVNKFTRPALQSRLIKLLKYHTPAMPRKEDSPVEEDEEEDEDEEEEEDEDSQSNVVGQFDVTDFTRVQHTTFVTPPPRANIEHTTSYVTPPRVSVGTSPGLHGRATPAAYNTSEEVLRRRQLRSSALRPAPMARMPPAKQQKPAASKRSIGWKTLVFVILLFIGCIVIYSNMEDSNIILGGVYF